jgi:hypothetical protein
MAKARLDADGTAKPKTRIVHHPNRDHCVGPGTKLNRPEFEAEDGTRIPLGKNPPSRVRWPRPAEDTSLSELVAQLKRIDDAESSDGQWIGNVRDDVMTELHRMRLTYRTGPDNEYLKLTQRGEDLVDLAEQAKAAE